MTTRRQFLACLAAAGAGLPAVVASVLEASRPAQSGEVAGALKILKECQIELERQNRALGLMAYRAAGLSWREAVYRIEPEKPLAEIITRALEGREAAGLFR